MNQSKYMQNDASAAKRAATTLRHIAERVQSLEDKGVLLAAARVAETYGKTRSVDAKEKKRQEQEYETFYRKAKAEAEAKIRAEWPMESTLQKVAILSISSYFGAKIDIYMVRYHSGFNTPIRILETEIDSAISDIASSVAYDCYHKKISVSEAIENKRRRAEDKHNDRDTILTAQRVDALLNSAATIAEAA